MERPTKARRLSDGSADRAFGSARSAGACIDGGAVSVDGAPETDGESCSPAKPAPPDNIRGASDAGGVTAVAATSEKKLDERFVFPRDATDHYCEANATATILIATCLKVFATFVPDAPQCGLVCFSLVAARML